MIFRVLRPPYKWRLLRYGAHTSMLLPFFGRNWNPRMMKCQGLVVFTGGPPRDSSPVFGSDGPLPVGVVFFPSFPFMGVMLFPSLVLGNASGESGILLVPLSPFSHLLYLSLLSSPSPSFSHSLFLSFSVFLPLFISPSPFLLLFLLLPLLVRTLFFFFSLFPFFF